MNYPIQALDQMMALQGTVESADTAPTAQSYVVYDELNAKLEPQLKAWQDAKSKDLAEFNELMKKNNIPAVAPAAEKPKDTGE